MAVFFSFHYERDYWRVQQILNMGALEGQTILKPQDWEAVKKQGDSAVQDWIDGQMKYKTAVVVLIGSKTADRKWVRYEITKAWDGSKPLVGIRIHGLADRDGYTDSSGQNPFERVKLKNGKYVSDYVPVYNPSGLTSKDVYANIKKNLESWVASAVKRS